MSLEVEAQAVGSTPQPKKQIFEEPAPQVNPTPQLKLFEIEDNDIKQETHPISFLRPITAPVILPPIVYVTQPPVDLLEGVLDNGSLSETRLSEITTISTEETSFPLSFLATIPSINSSRVVVSPSKVTK